MVEDVFGDYIPTYMMSKVERKTIREHVENINFCMNCKTILEKKEYHTSEFEISTPYSNIYCNFCFEKL